MAVAKGKGGLLKGLVLALGLAGVLAWAWHDGGEQPLRELNAPAQLPGPAQ